MGTALAWTIELDKETSGFTPVRRRLSTINTRHAQSESEVEWTATRCNRLLRALTSRVAVLRKELSRYQFNTTSRVQVAVEETCKTRRRNTAQASDTDWNLARKRIKRTYSGRGGGKLADYAKSGLSRIPSLKDNRGSIPGEVSVPTPVLNRARGDLPRSFSPVGTLLGDESLEQIVNRRNKKRPRTKDGEAHFQLCEMMRELKRKTSPSRYTTYAGIYNGLETLLKATASDKPKERRKGPGTLLSMCLGAVPQYISQEEAYFEAQLEETGKRSAIDNKDISTEVYADLEAFGSCGNGWKHLRTIVRSHGLRVVCDAVQDGLLDISFCDILVTLCTHVGASKEAEIILSSLLSSRLIPTPSTLFSRFEENEQSRPLSILCKFADKLQCFSFQYRQLSTMVSTGYLPLTWAATKEFGPVWIRVMQTLSCDPMEADTLIFMDVMLSMFASMAATARGARNLKKAEIALLEATKQTFSSLVTTLTAMIVLSKETASDLDPSESQAFTSKYNHILMLLRSSLIHWKLSHKISSQGTLLLLANIIIEEQDNTSNIINLDLLLKHLQQVEGFVEDVTVRDDLVAFLSTTARCCGRGASTQGLEHLERLHSVLEQLASNRDRNEKNLLYGIIVDSAFAFAQQVPDRKHLEYAVSVERRFHVVKTDPAQNLTPGNGGRQARGGYRWEEGICEWVTSTPAVYHSREYDLPTYLLRDELDHGMPSKTSRRKVTKVRANLQVSSQAPLSPGSASNHNGCSGTASDARDPSLSRIADLDGTVADNMASSPSQTRHSYYEGTADELIDSTSDRQSATDISDTESEVRASPGYNKETYLNGDLVFDESSMISCSSRESRSRRQRVDRAPRLSRRVLRHSLQWQLFEESDDELSFQSATSLPDDQLFQDISNISTSTKPRGAKSFSTKRQQPPMNVSASRGGDSEDELCR